MQTKTVQSTVLDDKHGDAPDCIIAAIATFRSRHDLIVSNPMKMPYALEGHVYA